MDGCSRVFAAYVVNILRIRKREIYKYRKNFGELSNSSCHLKFIEEWCMERRLHNNTIILDYAP